MLVAIGRGGRGRACHGDGVADDSGGAGSMVREAICNREGEEVGGARGSTGGSA